MDFRVQPIYTLSSWTDAQQAMVQSFIRLNYIMPYPTIKVSHICKEAHVARSTFYVYYENIDMLLTDIENNELYHIMDITRSVPFASLQEDMMIFFSSLVDYIKERKSLYYLFLIHEPKYSFIHQWKEAIKYHLYERIQEKSLTPSHLPLTLELIASQVITFITFILQHPYEVTDQQLHRLVMHSLQFLSL